MQQGVVPPHQPVEYLSVVDATARQRGAPLAHEEAAIEATVDELLRSAEALQGIARRLRAVAVDTHRAAGVIEIQDDAIDKGSGRAPDPQHARGGIGEGR